MKKNPILRINERDDLIVALHPLHKGEVVTIGGEELVLRQDIPSKHKFAARPMAPGQSATMYGITVGRVTRAIARGELITTSNLRHATTEPILSDREQNWQPPSLPTALPDGFLGYDRGNGTAGTANYWIFVPLVFCSNQELLLIRDILPRLLGITRPSRYESFAADLIHQMQQGRAVSEAISIQPISLSPPSPVFANLDGIKFLTHSLGCGGTRADARSLCGLLADYITHPNVAGATVVSLGCQNAEISVLKEEITRRTNDLAKPLFFFDRQSW
ncbi:MAG: UxaA family hydrolase, partial [Desulfofustis sp.]|nr:UxaA family hydrolase [Desulfofustis sp.]